MEILSLVAELALGLGTGLVTGMMGVGGGVVIVPAMLLLLGLEQHVAQGVSLAAIFPAAVSGAVTHYRQKNVIVPLMLSLGLASIIGALIGAWLAGMLEATVLRRVFGAFLVVISLRMMFGR